MSIATYTKLKNGQWGVRVQGEVEPGQRLTVSKKSGQTQTKTIAKVLWTDGKVSLCAIAAGHRSSGTQRDYPGKMCPACGSEPLNQALYCWECGYQGS